MINKSEMIKSLETLSTMSDLGHEKMLNDLMDMHNTGEIVPGKTMITVVDRIIRNSDGTEMFEYLGSNATTMVGTQTIVENTFANLDLSQFRGNTIQTIDGPDGAPKGWSFVPELGKGKEDYDSDIMYAQPPRKIFGFMVADDGAVGNTVKVVNRRTKGYEIDHILPFFRRSTKSDMPFDYLHLGTTNTANMVSDHPKTKLDVENLRQAISTQGKYALRIEKAGANEAPAESAYLAKLINFNVANIMVDGTIMGDENMNIKQGLDVRTRVMMRLAVSRDELSTSTSHELIKGPKNIRGAMMSSIMLVAGRPTIVNLPSTGAVSVVSHPQAVTYKDVVVTNRINFVELPIDETELHFRYTIYYV